MIWGLQVTKRVPDGGNDYGGWENWNWRSVDDMFMNGAFFTDSGSSNVESALYAKATSFAAKPSSSVESLTANAGPFQCGPGVPSCFLYSLRTKHSVLVVQNGTNVMHFFSIVIFFAS